MATEKIILDIQAQVAGAKKQIGELGKGVKGVNKEVTNSNKLFQKAAVAIGAMFSVALITNFTKKIIEVRSEFEKYNAVLKNTLGSAKAANIEFEKIKQFAAQTPFSVLELTNAFVKLTNQGFKPTREEMRKLGDLAASTGKTFDMLAEAIIDATVGEFERLKEFGIRAKKSGDQVTFTFKEVEKRIDFTAKAIREYILSLGDAIGVSGAMDEISKTLGGKISNLGDSWDSLLDTIGGRTSGLFNAVIRGLGNFITAAENAGKSVADLREEVALMNMGSETELSVDEFLKFTKIAKQEGETYAEVAERFLAVDKKRIENFDRLTTDIDGFRTVATRASTELTDLLSDEEQRIFDLLNTRVAAIEKFAKEEDLAEQSRSSKKIGKESDALLKLAKKKADFENHFLDKKGDMAEAALEQEINRIDREIAANEELYEKKTALALDDFNKGRDTAAKKQEIDDDLTQLEIGNALSILDTAQYTTKEGGALYKANAIAKTTISAYTTAQAAAESLASIPYIGGILAAAAYIAFLATGLDTVAKITSTSFKEGGFTGKSKYPFKDEHGPIAGLVHEDEFVFSKEKTSHLRPLFEDIHSGRIDARGLAALTRRGVIMPLINNEFNSAILEREVGKIYKQIREKEPQRYSIETVNGYKKVIGNTTINVKT